MVLTASIRSRQLPSALRTLAWPPSLPSVPTSRVTRVISSAIDGELVDQAVDVLGEPQRLAAQRLAVDRTSIRWVRSPSETA